MIRNKAYINQYKSEWESIDSSMEIDYNYLPHLFGQPPPPPPSPPPPTPPPPSLSPPQSQFIQPLSVSSASTTLCEAHPLSAQSVLGPHTIKRYKYSINMIHHIEACVKHVVGLCDKGFRCPELHIADVQTQFCLDFLMRNCSRGKCKYLHCSQSEVDEFESSGQLPDHALDSFVALRKPYGYSSTKSYARRKFEIVDYKDANMCVPPPLIAYTLNANPAVTPVEIQPKIEPKIEPTPLPPLSIPTPAPEYAEASDHNTRDSMLHGDKKCLSCVKSEELNGQIQVSEENVENYSNYCMHYQNSMFNCCENFSKNLQFYNVKVTPFTMPDDRFEVLYSPSHDDGPFCILDKIFEDVITHIGSQTK